MMKRLLALTTSLLFLISAQARALNFPKHEFEKKCSDGEPVTIDVISGNPENPVKKCTQLYNFSTCKFEKLGIDLSGSVGPFCFVLFPPAYTALLAYLFTCAISSTASSPLAELTPGGQIAKQQKSEKCPCGSDEAKAREDCNLPDNNDLEQSPEEIANDVYESIDTMEDIASGEASMSDDSKDKDDHSISSSATAGSGKNDEGADGVSAAVGGKTFGGKNRPQFQSGSGTMYSEGKKMFGGAAAELSPSSITQNEKGEEVALVGKDKDAESALEFASAKNKGKGRGEGGEHLKGARDAETGLDSQNFGTSGAGPNEGETMDEYLARVGSLSIFERVHPHHGKFGDKAALDAAASEFKSAVH